MLFIDTIGFIQDLPPELIAAFQSTLEDSLEADILLHVYDVSDSWCEEKIQIVNDTLDLIGATQPRILVANKIDRLEVSPAYWTDLYNTLNISFHQESTISHGRVHFSGIPISAEGHIGIEYLKKYILSALNVS